MKSSTVAAAVCLLAARASALVAAVPLIQACANCTAELEPESEPEPLSLTDVIAEKLSDSFSDVSGDIAELASKLQNAKDLDPDIEPEIMSLGKYLEQAVDRMGSPLLGAGRFVNQQSPLPLFDPAESLAIQDRPSISTRWKVPGTNNFYHCSDPSEYALDISDVTWMRREKIPHKNETTFTITTRGHLVKDLMNTELEPEIQIYDLDKKALPTLLRWYLCDEGSLAQDSRATCPPVRTGAVEMERSIPFITNQLPKETMVIRAEAKSSNGDYLYCMQGQYHPRGD